MTTHEKALAQIQARFDYVPPGLVEEIANAFISALTTEPAAPRCPQCDFGIGGHEPGCPAAPQGVDMPTDPEWYRRKANEEGDHEISAGRHLTSTINPSSEEIAEMERLALDSLPQWARDEIIAAQPATPQEAEAVAWQRRLLPGPHVKTTDWHTVTKEQADYSIKHGHPYGVPSVRCEVRPLYTSPPARAVTEARFAGKASMQRALDVADRLLERAYGTDVPAEWHRAFREVQKATTAAQDAGNV